MISSNAPCWVLEWDSNFFGFRVAQVCGDTLDPTQIQKVDTWCRQAEVTCLYFLARADDAQTTRLAQDHLFRLVDIRVTLEFNAWETLKKTGDQTTRRAQAKDVPALQAVAQTIHRDTRFYFDEKFPRHLCDQLYSTWIKLSCEGYADVVLVTESEDKPAGYISCHCDKETRTGKIGLVGVCPSAQGRGLGQALVSDALIWFFKQGISTVSVVTQGRNCAAQRLYQRCGFLTKSVQLWYHKWY